MSSTSDAENRSESSRDWKTLTILARYLWPQGEGGLRLRVLIAVAFLVAAKLVNVYVPFLYKESIDALSVEQALIALPIGVILAYGGAKVLTTLFGELRDAIFVNVAQHALRNIALETFRHLHALSLRFHLDRQTGGLSRSIERGTRGIIFVLNFMTFNIIPTLLEILLVCVILYFAYDFWYSLITFVTIAGYIAFTLIVTNWRLKFRREMNKRDNEANTKAIDSLLNFETVKYFGNEAHEAARYDQSLQRYQTAAIQSQTSLAALNVGQGAIIAVGLTLVMLMAGQGVVDGTMTVGDFVLVNTYLIQLYMPLGFLGFVYREMKQSLVDMEKMFTLLDEHQDVADSPDAKPLKVDRAAVSFKDVHFAYNPDRPILKGISFDVPAGKTVAIVGASGAGKSTISRLLFRFYDVNQGTVTIDGQDLRSVTQGSVRDAIGIVPQDTVLFNDTIAYNIRYGRPDATEAEVEEAARLAQIGDFIKALPDGFKTVVGERGLKLSGGEKQRVAIARTLLKNPPVLLFDEATSALDTHTEKEIQAALREVSKDRTTLVIAHRLSTVVDADEIIVMEAGQIVERGKHQDLLAHNKVYAAMWARQQETVKAEEMLQQLKGAGE